MTLGQDWVGFLRFGMKPVFVAVMEEVRDRLAPRIRSSCPVVRQKDVKGAARHDDGETPT